MEKADKDIKEQMRDLIEKRIRQEYKIKASKWEEERKSWKEKIEFASSIVNLLIAEGIAVRIYVTGNNEARYIVVSRFEKLYEDFRLSILNLNKDDDRLDPFVKDTATGLSYGFNVSGSEKPKAEDFVDLFLWVMGKTSVPNCADKVKDPGELGKKPAGIKGMKRHLLTLNRQKNLKKSIKTIVEKVIENPEDEKKYYTLDEKKELKSVNPAQIVSDLETEGAKFERLLWLAIKKNNLKLDSVNDDQKQYNKKIENYCISFNDAGAKSLKDIENEDGFEHGILISVKEGLAHLGYKEIEDENIMIDDQGIIRYRVVADFVNENNNIVHVNVTGYLGQVFAPEESGLVETKYKHDNEWFVPGYYAFVDPGEQSIEKRTRLYGYKQMMKAAVRMQLIRDRLLVYDAIYKEPSKNKTGGYSIVLGEETNLNDLYKSLYDERFKYDPLAEDGSIDEFSRLKKGVREAIVKTLAKRVRYPECLYKAGIKELVEGNTNSVCLINDTTIFDPDATSSGKNQGLVRYLVEGASVNDDGTINKSSKEEDRTPIFTTDFLKKYSRYNPFDRNQMVFSNLMKAYSLTDAVETVLMTCGGWNMEDGFVVSKKFAETYKVPDKKGNLRPLKIGDKMLDRGGNKGVISVIVDSDDEKLPEKLRKVFIDNPDLAVIASPYSGLSRYNGATAREMMENPSDLKDGEKVYEKCIGKVQYIITRQFADKKTKIYDEDDYAEGSSRKASPQLSWALCSKEARKMISYLYSRGDKSKEDLNAVQALLEAKGLFDERVVSGDLRRFVKEIPDNKKTIKYEIDIPDELKSGKGQLDFYLVPSGLRRGFRLESGKTVDSKLGNAYRILKDIISDSYDENKDILDKEVLAKNKKYIEKQIDKINYIINRDFFSGKENIFKTLVMTRAVENSSTAIWTPDPTLSIESIAVSKDIAEKLGVKKNDYLLIWRDPILRDANVRYMKVERCDDPNLTGIAINPVMAKGFDGDFDGDTVAVVKIDAEKYKDVHEEAIDKFSVKNNLRDEGKTDEPLFINTGLDLVSVEKVNKPDGFNGFKDMKTVEEIDKALQSVFENDYYLDNAMIKLADDKSVIGSLEKIRDSGAKKGDLDNYIRYFNNTENSETPLPDSERIKVQKATAIKAAVGVAGRYSQQLMRAFRDEFPKAVLELTYPNTQALLQAKHDPERAVEVYKILQDSLFVEFNKDMRKILSPEEEEELKKRTEWIKDIYNKLGQPIGDGGIKESYLDQICAELDYRSLEDCHGSILDECAYGHLDLDDYEYEEPDEDTLKPIAYLSNAGELLSYNPSLEEGKESFCKSFFDEWMKSK